MDKLEEFEMKKLLYESKGGSKQAQKIVLVCSIILIICGILFWKLCTYLPSGSVRTTFVFIGMISCIFAIVMLIFRQRAQKSYFKIFENHVEGSIYDGIVQHEYNLTFHEIEDIQITRMMGFTIIILQTKYKKYPVPLDNNNGEEALRLIRERIS